MRLAGYCRASIEKGREGLQGQIERLERWSSAHDHDVIVFPETASAKEGSPRPVFDDAMERVVDGEFDGFLVEKLDRFGRSLGDIIRTTDILRDAGRTFIVFGNGLRLEPGREDAMTTMFFQMLAVFAEFERAIIYERLQQGRERAKAMGKHLGRPAMKNLPIEEIQEWRGKGASYKFLAAHYDISVDTVRRHLRRYERGEYPYGSKPATNRVKG